MHVSLGIALGIIGREYPPPNVITMTQCGGRSSRHEFTVRDINGIVIGKMYHELNCQSMKEAEWLKINREIQEYLELAVKYNKNYRLMDRFRIWTPDETILAVNVFNKVPNALESLRYHYIQVRFGNSKQEEYHSIFNFKNGIDSYLKGIK